MLGEIGETIDVIYKKWHNNYEPLTVEEKYEAIQYKKGWLLIHWEDWSGYEDRALFREECFERC